LVYNSPFVYTARAHSKASDEDDDFIVPSDSEVETRSIKSSSSRSSGASRRSGGASSADEDDFEQDEDEEPKKKGKKSTSTQAKGNSKALAGSGASATFLTAAEQREQGKKEQKKAAESPYSFLADNIRDVRKLFFVGIFLSKFIKCMLNRKRAVNPTTQIMIPGPYLSHRRCGKRLLLSKNRFVYFRSSCKHVLTLS
jgi:hypothetical protein